MLSADQRRALAEVVEAGPIPAAHGVVRWRLIDLARWVWDEFALSISKQTLSRELRALGYRKLSARPRHHAQDADAIPLSSNQLHRTLGVTLRTAWSMSHRIREAMRSDDLAPFGSGGGIVEVVETFIGHDKTIKPEGVKKGRGYAHKHKGLSLIDRDTGRQRSMVVDSLKGEDLMPILKANIAKESRHHRRNSYYGRSAALCRASLHSDSAGQYVDYENPTIHTHTIEGAFSIFKRGMRGVYQHCAKKHLGSRPPQAARRSRRHPHPRRTEAPAGEDHAADSLVLVRIDRRLEQRLGERDSQGIARRGTVERQRQDRADARDCKRHLS